MSTNCVRCVVNERESPSLLCSKCQAEEWDKNLKRSLAQYPALATFVDTYAPHSGTSREVFAGQSLRMVLDVIKQTEQMLDPNVMYTTVADIMKALVDNIEEDILLALRYAYYVHAKPLVPDTKYDEAETEYVNRPEIEDTPLMNPGSDKEQDYPARVRALCLYLGLARLDQSTGKARNAALAANPSPFKAPRKGKGAKQEPEASEPLTWGKLF